MIGTSEAVQLEAGSAHAARRLEWGGIAVCAVLYWLLRVAGLRSAVIGHDFDSGVYFSLMQAVAAGKGALYRDFILCHPPGVVWAGTWLWPRVQGNLFTLRLIYIAVVALGFVPVYALARRFYGTQAALLTLFLMATSPGFANWLGRTVYLEPLLNVPLYAALWALVALPRPDMKFTPTPDLTPQPPLLAVRASLGEGESAQADLQLSPRRTSVPAYIGVGVLLAVSFLIKETALPAAFMLCLALLIAGRFPPQKLPDTEETGEGISRNAWLWVGGACLMTFGVVIACLARIPNYIYYTFTLNAQDVYEWRLRPHELLNGFYALPLPLTFGVVGVFWMTRYSRSRAERLLGLFTILMALLMLLLPKRFYWRYLTPVLPLLCLGVAVWWQRFQQSRPSRRARIGVGVFATLFGLVHVVGLVLYHLVEAPNPPGYAMAIRILRASPDPLFTLDPIWAAASGHPLTPQVQRLIRATIYVPVTPQEYTSVLLQCPTVLLNKDTLRWLPPESQQALSQHYKTIFQEGRPGDRGWVAVLQRAGP
jgi:hypothetical protein